MQSGDKSHTEDFRHLIGELKDLEEDPDRVEAMQTLSAQLLAKMPMSLN